MAGERVARHGNHHLAHGGRRAPTESCARCATKPSAKYVTRSGKRPRKWPLLRSCWRRRRKQAALLLERADKQQREIARLLEEYQRVDADSENNARLLQKTHSEAAELVSLFANCRSCVRGLALLLRTAISLVAVEAEGPSARSSAAGSKSNYARMD